MERPIYVNQLSTKASSSYKKLFPILFFSCAAILYIWFVSAMLYDQEFDWLILCTPLILAVIGYFMMKDGMIGLVDEVIDCGEYLLIKQEGNETQVYLSDIVQFEYAYATNPPMVSMTYQKYQKNGKTIRFSPALQGDLSRPDPEIQRLIQRIEAAKKQEKT